MTESKRYYCEKCKKTRPAKEFYTSNNLTKYPNDGKLNLCKDCLTMHLDNWNSETYLYILQELDVPYVPEEWNSIMGKYCLDPSKVTGTTVLGRYLSRMKLSQYKNYRWKDSDFIQKVKNKDKTEAMRQLGYDQAAIDEAIAADPQAPVPPPPPPEPTLPPVDPNEELANQIEAALVADLTEEDRKYLCLKWGKGYNPDEWIRLEELYKQMLDSYEIEQAGDLNTLKLACKASLKANQLLDIGDIDGAQKAGKMYDTFMKSGKWTAQQKPEEEVEFIDSVGEIVLICEREGFIPRYYVDTPQDKADRTLQDVKEYTCRLIENETGLATMISRANKQMEVEEARLKAAAEAGEDAEEASLFNYEEIPFEDEDYAEFDEYIEIERSAEE